MRNLDDNSSGRLVKRIRERLRFSQKSVAYRADIHPSHLARFETGAITPPVETVVRILDVLDVNEEEREIVLTRVCAERIDWTEFKRYRPKVNQALAAVLQNLMLMDEKKVLALNDYIATCVE